MFSCALVETITPNLDCQVNAQGALHDRSCIADLADQHCRVRTAPNDLRIERFAGGCGNVRNLVPKSSGGRGRMFCDRFPFCYHTGRVQEAVLVFRFLVIVVGVALLASVSPCKQDPPDGARATETDTIP